MNKAANRPKILPKYSNRNRPARLRAVHDCEPSRRAPHYEDISLKDHCTA